MTANTRAMYVSGMSWWNRSDMLSMKILRGVRQVIGSFRRSGRRVMSKPASKWWPGMPRHRSAKVAA
jgi:hypothetical protein